MLQHSRYLTSLLRTQLYKYPEEQNIDGEYRVWHTCNGLMRDKKDDKHLYFVCIEEQDNNSGLVCMESENILPI